MLTTLATLLALSSAPGSLVILGGGTEAPAAIQEVIKCAGGPAAKIVILAQSRENPEKSATSLADFFKENGATNVVAPKTSDPNEILEALKGARGIYMSGGDQNLFMKRFPESTQVPAAIRTIFNTGGVISGTSAGASLIGEWMPTGNDKEGDSILPSEPSIAPGLKVWPGHIIDQHFLKRGRLARLLTLLETRPKLEGLGIDEKAYVVIDQGKINAFIGQSIWVKRKSVGKFDIQVINPPSLTLK